MLRSRTTRQRRFVRFASLAGVRKSLLNGMFNGYSTSGWVVTFPKARRILYWEIHPDGKIQHFSWITDFTLDAEARNGICSVCHVRLRPQVFNTVLKNEEILQCDSCNRILFFIPTAAPATPDSVSQPTS